MANTDFLRFNAYSIKDLINRKLSEDSNFTDQIYSGSNLAVLIDIFSYMAQLLLYSLNNAAAESMFSDTQLYENMNRLCNFIGYNPKGMSPASVVCKFSFKSEDSNLKRIIFPYSFVDTGKIDSTGKNIYYSVSNTIDSQGKWTKESTSSENGIEINTMTRNITMYNGKWKLYKTVFISDGNPWQTFILTGLTSNTSLNEYVSHNFFDVYVVENNTDTEGKTIPGRVYKFKQTSFQLFKNPFKINVENNVIRSDGFYNTNGFLYSGNLEDSENGTIFNLKLNENKNYVISFGDGSTGAIPPKGSSIYIVYLDSNGPNGIIDVNDIYESKLQINTVNLSKNILEQVWFNGVIEADSVFSADDDDTVTNITASTVPILEESVDEIRSNAPNWFKIGNRLVTKSDYEYFLKTHPGLASSFSDILCMNNWDYICSFFKWLYDLGIKSSKDSRKYLNQNKLIKSDYRIADAADANNIYLWYVPSNVNTSANRTAEGKISLMNDIINVIEPIKDLTHEPIIVPGIPVRFELCAVDYTVAKKWITDGGTTNFVNNNLKSTYLEITLNDNYIYSSANIYSLIAEKFSEYFLKFSKFGGAINFGEIVTMISEIEGINKIRTVYTPVDGSSPIIYNGISMASWTTDNNNLIDEGVDFEIGNSGRSLEKFQYAYFDIISIANLVKQIKVIKTTASMLNQTQY